MAVAKLILLFLSSFRHIQMQLDRDHRTICEFRYDYQSAYDVGYFRYHDIPTPWEDARRLCRLEGAEIASPLTPEIRAAMMRVMIEKPSNQYVIHTGYSTRYLAGYYLSIGGARLHNTDNEWEPQEPYRARKFLNNVAMDTDGRMSLVDFDTHLPFICYRNYTIPCLKMSKFGSSNEGYNERSGDFFYKYHFVPQTWESAVATCFGEGSYLAIPQEEEQVAFIMEVFKKYKDKAYNITSNKEVIHAGFREDPLTGEWLTLFDQTLGAAGFETWQGSYPKYDKKDEFCGTMRVDNSVTLQNVNCNETKLTFICMMGDNAEKYKKMNVSDNTTDAPSSRIF